MWQYMMGLPPPPNFPEVPKNVLLSGKYTFPFQVSPSLYSRGQDSPLGLCPLDLKEEHGP